MGKKSWYSAKGLFKHLNTRTPKKQTRYEESIIILRAADEKGAEKTARDIYRKAAQKDFVFLKEIEICPIFDDPASGTEVYWFQRLSPLSAKAYVKGFWDDGKPRNCHSVGWKHLWYNRDNKRSGCYNCYTTRVGRWDSLKS